MFNNKSGFNCVSIFFIYKQNLKLNNPIEQQDIESNFGFREFDMKFSWKKKRSHSKGNSKHD